MGNSFLWKNGRRSGSPSAFECPGMDKGGPENVQQGRVQQPIRAEACPWLVLDRGDVHQDGRIMLMVAEICTR